MKRARERNAARWRELDIDGQIIVKVEEDNADVDLSPPRSRGTVADISPPRSRIKSDPDASPPRRRPMDTDDISPPRVRVKREPGADEDLSPPRGRSTGDSSPPRRPPAGDISPPRRRKDDAEDISPPRKRNDADGDLSPVRKKARGAMEGGGRAGLFLGNEIAQEEEERRRKTREELRKMDPKSSGQGAATIYRDRRGKVLSGLTQMIAQEEGKVET